MTCHVNWKLFSNLQSIDAFSRLDHCGGAISLQNLLVFGFEERKTGAGLGKHEETHVWQSVLGANVGGAFWGRFGTISTCEILKLRGSKKKVRGKVLIGKDGKLELQNMARVNMGLPAGIVVSLVVKQFCRGRWRE